MSLLTNKFLLDLKSKVRTFSPGLLVIMSRTAARFVYFKNERAYLRGDRDAETELPSILFFAPERCATQYSNALISKIYGTQGGKDAYLPNYFFHANPKEGRRKLYSKEWAGKNLVPKGYFFGCLNQFNGEGSLNYNDYTLLATVRDPRDVMVSSFYSIAYAHTPSSKEFARDAKEARENGIDWYVRQEWRIAEISEKLAFIKNHIAIQPHSYVWKYEDMRSDFPGFLNQLADHIVPNCNVDNLLAEMVQEEAQDREAKIQKKSDDDLKSHQRSGASGQYKNKLNPESVAFLNEKYAEFIEFFGYEK